MKWLLVAVKTAGVTPPKGTVSAVVVDGPAFKGTYTNAVLRFIGLKSTEYKDIIPLTEEVKRALKNSHAL